MVRLKLSVEELEILARLATREYMNYESDVALAGEYPDDYHKLGGLFNKLIEAEQFYGKHKGQEKETGSS